MKIATLFSIKIEHEYRSNISARGLSLVPAAETMRQLKRLGWIFSGQGGSYSVAAETNPDSSALRIPPPDKMALRFWFVCGDQFFANYTDLPETAGKKLLFFSNRNSTAENNFLLHTTTTAGAADILPLPVAQPVFETPNEGDVVLRDAAGSIITKATATPPKTYPRLVTGDEGWCTSETGGEVSAPFYIGTPPMGMNVKGVAEIWYDSTLTGGQNYLDANSVPTGITYTIRFAARSVLWKYVITGRNLDDYTSLAVTDLKRTLFFTGPEQVTLISGSKALAFTSPAPIRFSDKQTASFQLRKNCVPDVSAGTPVIERLPHAVPELLQQSDTNFYSEIIINL
jgi:hypothetical protein